MSTKLFEHTTKLHRSLLVENRNLKLMLENAESRITWYQDELRKHRDRLAELKEKLDNGALG